MIKKQKCYLKHSYIYRIKTTPMKKLLSLFGAIIFCTVVNGQTPLTTAVDFTATDVHGNSHNLFTYLNSGKYVLIDFFYTTYGPCQTAAPQVNASYENFGCNTSGVIFLGIDLGDNDTEVLAFDNTYGVHYPCISGDAGGSNICSTYGISAYPTIILIAPDKSIVVQDMWPSALASATAPSVVMESALLRVRLGLQIMRKISLQAFIPIRQANRRSLPLWENRIPGTPFLFLT